MAGIGVAKGYDVEVKKVDMPEACKVCKYKEGGCFEHCKFLEQRISYEKQQNN